MTPYYDLTDRQYGAFNLTQTRRLGIPDDVIHRRARAGDLISDYDSVYRLAGSPRFFEQRCMAATLVDPSVLISHGAARALWDLPDCRPGRLEVTIPHGSEFVLRGVTVHRSRRIDPEDRARRRLIPVTSATRTLIDSAADMPVSRMYELMDTMYQRGDSSPELTLARLDAINGRGRKGTRLIRDLVKDYDGNAVPRSVFERRFYEALRRAGIRLPARNVLIPTRLGRIEVDHLWTPEGFVLETDGSSFHDLRRRAKDDERKRAALVAVGLTVMTLRFPRLKYEELDVMQDVGRSLEVRARNNWTIAA